jgi:hypothetical protein
MDSSLEFLFIQSSIKRLAVPVGTAEGIEHKNSRKSTKRLSPTRHCLNNALLQLWYLVGSVVSSPCPGAFHPFSFSLLSRALHLSFLHSWRVSSDQILLVVVVCPLDL